MNFHDVELLSAYLDGRLNPAESAQLKSRLGSDARMRAIMDDLRTSRGLLRQLPQRRVPRNFTLTPKMAGLKAPVPRVYPSLRLATVLAALLFVITFAVNGVAPFAASWPAAAPAPAYGYGGGGGGGGRRTVDPAKPDRLLPGLLYFHFRRLHQPKYFQPLRIAPVAWVWRLQSSHLKRFHRPRHPTSRLKSPTIMKRQFLLSGKFLLASLA